MTDTTSWPGSAVVAAVFVGGLTGTALRLGIDAIIPHADVAFPLSTLLINTIGSFSLGVLVARLWQRAPYWLRAGLGPGLLGSFTTFSAVAVSLLSLRDDLGLTALYLGLTLLLGFGAAAAGLALGPRRAIGADE